MNSLSHQGEAVSCITTQQSAVIVSRRGKQNITRYVKDSARFTIISQSEKIGKEMTAPIFQERHWLIHHFLSISLNDWERKIYIYENGGAFRSPLWFSPVMSRKNLPTTTAQNKLGEILYINQILLHVLRQLDPRNLLSGLRTVATWNRVTKKKKASWCSVWNTNKTEENIL